MRIRISSSNIDDQRDMITATIVTQGDSLTRIGDHSITIPKSDRWVHIDDVVFLSGGSKKTCFDMFDW
jgi:hypothetical protein